MKKYIIGAVLLVLAWLPAACSKKVEPIKTEPVKIEQPITKPSPVVKKKAQHKPVHKAKPSPQKQEACTILGIFPVDC